jgi:release factor glutamine methyltransferase
MKPDRESVRKRKLFLLARAKQTLEQAGVERPDSESELLLAAALGIDRARLHTGSFCFDDYAIARFDGFIARRASREPLAYIVGHKEFYSLEFEVTRDVLIPRPETELLAATALEVLRERPHARVLDIGTGSGAIAITIALGAPVARVMATDISAAALAVARRNAERLGCASRIEFAAGDGFAALTCSHPKFDLIVSNPPYIPADELARLEPEVARFEPEVALLGGKDGLEFYRRIAREVGSHLIGGGEVMVEVGAGQAGQVADLLEESGCRVHEVLRDLSGHERVVRARRAD